MRTREYPVLSENDSEVVDRLTLGLGEDTARVLAYLLLRNATTAFADEPATRLEIRIGTGVSRHSVSEALSMLEEHDFVAETTVETDQGRPPQAWYPHDGVGATVSRVYHDHAVDLLRQSVDVIIDLGATGLHKADIACDDSPTGGRLTIGLNWFSNPRHFPLFGGRVGENYQSYGLDVDFHRFDGSGVALDGLLTGDADVVVAGAASLVRTWSEGAPLVPLAPLVQRAETVLYTTPETFGGRLNSVEQLRGRRVGMPVDSETGLLGRLLLSQSDILDDITIVDIAGEERETLRSGKADIVTGMGRDVREFEAAGEVIDTLPVADHFPIYGPTLVTTKRAVQRRKATLVAFLAGTVAGAGEIFHRPERVLRVIRNYGEGSDDDVREREAIADELQDVSGIKNHGWGWHESDGWRRLITALRQAELLTDSP